MTLLRQLATLAESVRAYSETSDPIGQADAAERVASMLEALSCTRGHSALSQAASAADRCRAEKWRRLAAQKRRQAAARRAARADIAARTHRAWEEIR